MGPPGEPRTTHATSAPNRISATRAGVAQYAASGPHTWAMTGAANGEHHRQRRDHAHRRPAAAAAPPEDAQEQQRPQPVELLLDGQRPVVVERPAQAGLRRGEVGVALPAGELHPVEHLEQRTQHVATQAGDAVEGAGGGQHAHGGEAHQAGGQQPSGTSGVERRARRPCRWPACSCSSSDVMRNPLSVKNTDTPR